MHDMQPDSRIDSALCLSPWSPRTRRRSRCWGCPARSSCCPRPRTTLGNIHKFRCFKAYTLRHYYGFFELQPIPTSSSLKHPQVSLLQDICSSTILWILRTSTHVHEQPFETFTSFIASRHILHSSTILWILRASSQVHEQPLETPTHFIASRRMHFGNITTSSNFYQVHGQPFETAELHTYTPSHPKRIVD